jgi:hypothetical protein
VCRYVTSAIPENKFKAAELGKVTATIVANLQNLKMYTATVFEKKSKTTHA